MNMKKLVMVFVFCAMGFALNAEIVNGSFEKTRVFDTGHREFWRNKGLKDWGWTFDEPLTLPEGWAPNGPGFRNGEYRLISDSSKAHSGNNCIYLKGPLMHEQSIDVTAGDEVEVSFYVKDKNKKSAGVFLYLYYREDKDTKARKRFTGSLYGTAKTEPEWTRQTVKIKIPEKSPEPLVNSINAVIVVLSSGTGAYFDDVEMVHTRTSAWLNFRDAFIEGNKKLALGNLDGARIDFNAGLSLTGESKERIEALLKIAESYLREKDYTRAVETFNTILAKEKPDDNTKADVYLRTADTYISAKDYDRAREAFSLVVKTENAGSNIKVHSQLRIADTYMQERNYDKAVEAFETLLKMNEARPVVKVTTMFKIGDTYVSARNYPQAREAYAKVPLMPAVDTGNRFNAYKKIGDTYLVEKNYTDAREYYNKALGAAYANSGFLPIKRADLFSTIARTYETEERYGEARETYKKLLNMGTGESSFTGSLIWRHQRGVYVHIGATYRKEKQYAEERATYADMLAWAERVIPFCGAMVTTEINATRADMLRLTGDSYWDEGNKEEAASYYLLFLETGRQDDNLTKQVEAKIGANFPALHIRKGNVLFKDIRLGQKYEEARAEYAKVLGLKEATFRQKAVAQILTGDTYLAQEDYNKARAEYLKVLRMKDAPQSEKARAQLHIADSYSMEQNYKQAKKEYVMVLGIAGVDPLQAIDAQEKVADMYRVEHDYPQAKKEYGKILKMDGLTSLRRGEVEQRMLSIYW